jgi:hypothetical protein
VLSRFYQQSGSDIQFCAMKYKLLTLLLPLCAFGLTEDPVHVCVRHLTLPIPYPILARSARLQGTVVAKLSISAEGTVIAAKVDAEDSLLVAHPLLQYATEQVCANGLLSVHHVRPAVHLNR